MAEVSTVQFYHLDHPEYGHDYTFQRKNPVKKVHEVIVPWVKCDACGEYWGNVSSRIPVDWPKDPLLLKKLAEPVLGLSEHQALRQQLERDTGIIVSPGQFPGATVGYISIELGKRLPSDFLWWSPGTIFITGEVKKALEEVKTKGCIFYPVRIIEPKKCTLELFELVVVGRAGPAAEESGISLIRECKACGYARHSGFTGLILNADNWDGSDICTVDEYPTYVLVSEKVKEVCELKGYKNYKLIPSEEL